MNDPEIYRQIKLLWAVLIASIVAGALCVTLVFAHLMHDANEFTQLWKRINEEHRK